MNGLNSSTFLTVVDFIRLLAPLVVGAVDGLVSLVKVIRSIGANPEQGLPVYRHADDGLVALYRGDLAANVEERS